MTLQQLKYVITVAETGTITEAANQLFISQPSLTNAIHELEKEMNIVIFNRTNKGISLSKEGEDFLGYARQVLEQAAILEDKYKRHGGGKKQFCVSTQHYSFAVNAFVDLIKEYGQEEYDFSLRETQTYEIIEDVARMRSEIGILFLNDFNEAVIGKILKSYDLEFRQLFIAKPHVFISRKHPLADKTVITNQELENYPYLSFEQGEHNSFYFSEEIFSESERKKNIRVRDRATLFNLLIGLNGYTVCSGVIDKKLNGSEIIAVPLAGESDMRIGYITHRKGIISGLGNFYLEALMKYIKKGQNV
ncbi:MAG: LysR family transcriptional regulator [Lachnospiraceae bacterium]